MLKREITFKDLSPTAEPDILIDTKVLNIILSLEKFHYWVILLFWKSRIVKKGCALLGKSLCLHSEIRHISCSHWPWRSRSNSSWGCSPHPQHGALATERSCRCVWRPSRSLCMWFQHLEEVCSRLGEEPAEHKRLEQLVGSTVKYNTIVNTNTLSKHLMITK